MTTPALFLYRAVATMASPLAGPLLRMRAAQGKEDPARLGERFGRSALQRPTGTLVWLHGASVGETRVNLLLRDALAVRRPDLRFLFTSGTRTSASLLAAPPANTLHQYAPLDTPGAAARFAQHWRPDLAVFAESEIWPNLLSSARAVGARIALVNARMSPKTLASWARRKGAAKPVFALFDAVLAADARTAEGLSVILGKDVPAPGNLKLAAPAPAIDEAKRAALAAAIGTRPVWLAASTHAGEDEIVLAAHALLRETRPDALLVIAPRHPERGQAVAALADGAPRRSLGEEIGDKPVYVADTMGELALFYAAAPVALVAGSLLPHLKGHNPVEPAKLGCAVLTGPHVESFAEPFALLRDAGAALEVKDAADIARAVDGLWRDGERRAAMTHAATAALATGGAALEATVAALIGLLPEAAHAGA